MKTILPILLLMVLLAGCSGNNDLSDAYGNFEVNDVMISAEASGKLIIFKPEEGKIMKKGELVAVIDSTDLSLKRKQMKAQLASVSSKIANINAQIDVREQQKKNLTTDKNRVEKLMKDGAATQKQMDDITGQLDVVEKEISSVKTQKTSVQAEMQALRAQIAQVEESISKCVIKNPLKGVVLDKYAEPFEITSFGKPLYKIANLDEMTLRVYVSGAQLPGIKIGQEVEVLVDQYEDQLRKLTGKITWISETAEFTPKIIQTREERVNLVYAVKIRVKNDGSLKIGMPGEVNFKQLN
ncbi:MAG: HlyD family efflux transporter periplasmic adaptor subunit [Bacteroidales bacterium]|nr:HlyD family efflux transporter periplasmic adaptor subunit [Bacteroidales bacterium]